MPGCAISRCVQGGCCCPLSQQCGSGFAGASEPRFLGIIFSSIFVIAGIIPALSFDPVPGPAQGDTSALLCPAPGAGSGCNCQENSSLMHPHPEQTSFTGRSCLGGVWGSFYCCLGLSSSLCCAGLSVSV